VILVGIVVTALIGFLAGTAEPPRHLVSLPPSITPIFWQLDFREAVTWRAFPIVLTVFIMAFVDTIGTLIGLSARAGFLDEEGNCRKSSALCWLTPSQSRSHRCWEPPPPEPS
jgi:AGZA family xanthine/uracil permease-like MFS transporter